MYNATNYVCTTTFSSDKVNSSLAEMLDGRFCHQIAFSTHFCQVINLTRISNLSSVMCIMKWNKKQGNQTLFFIQKVSKWIIFWKPSCCRKNNADSNGAITILIHIVVLLESVAMYIEVSVSNIEATTLLIMLQTVSLLGKMHILLQLVS